MQLFNIKYAFNFADEFSPGTPPPGHERKTTSYFQPMLDLQRFQQYVAEEQSKYIENHATPLLTGHGSDHVPAHGSVAAGQATIPLTVGPKIIGESSGLVHGGRGSDHVAPHSSFPLMADHASQPPSFLTQESADTVIAGGPNFVKPGARKSFICDIVFVFVILQFDWKAVNVTAANISVPTLFSYCSSQFH